MRAFTPVFGLSIYSTTAVLCAFMTGLGTGSALAPHLIRGRRRRSWIVYAGLELGIGLGAILIPHTLAPITDLYVAVSQSSAYAAWTGVVRFLGAFVVMLLPTFFMGLTLPALIHAAGARTTGRSDTTGLLYGLNTVGAAVGCIVVGFVLMQRFGISGTTHLTAALNFVIAAAVLLRTAVFARSIEPETAEKLPSAAECGAAEPVPMQKAPLLLLYFLTGVVSFGFELCWLRILVFYLQSSTHSFSIMLAVHLAGLGLGSLYFARVLYSRLAAAGSGAFRASSGLKAFLVLQLLVALFGMSTLHIANDLVPVWANLIQAFGADSWWMINVQKAVISGLLIFPAALLMGMVFPLLAAIRRAEGTDAHAAVGELYAANTAGAVAGSLLTGFVLFDLIGIQNTLTALSLLSAVVGLAAGGRLFLQDRRTSLFAGILAVMVVGLFAATPPRMLIQQFERRVGKVLFYRESAADITFAYERRSNDETYRALAFHDGRGTSNTRHSANYVNRLLAYSTMAIKPDAKRVLVISFGCGNTASAYLRFPIERLDVVDISPGAFEAADYFPTNLGVIHDPRLHTHVEDGRNFLLKSSEQYDIIELELPTLHTDGVVFLYTREFYEIAAARLAPGGLLSQWIDVLQTQREPSYTLINTMRQRFPEATVWASHWAWWVNAVKDGGPIRVDAARMLPLFGLPAVEQDMARINSSVPDLLARLVASPSVLAETVASSGVITDDHTALDYLVPQLQSPHAFGGGIAYYTSPLAGLFLGRWQAQHLMSQGYLEFIPFYADRYDAQVERSLREVVVGFPEETLTQVQTRAALSQ